MTGLTEAVVGRLEELRGWTPAALERLEVGFDGDRVVFPVRDRSGEVVGLLRYAPNPERRSGPKMLADRGTPRELFPPPEDIGEDEADGTVWLVEGEPDAIRLWSLGLAAVAVPGAQNWRDEWAARFSGRRLRVVVCFDCDQAGRENANRAAAALFAIGVDVRVVDLDPGRDDGYDLTDFLAAAATPEQREESADLMRQVAEAATLYEPAGAETGSAAADPTVTFAEFVARRDETTTAPLISTEREGTMLPGGGLVILAAKVGDGKTTVTVEFVLHAGAGLEYLGLLFPRPLNVLVIENEGPREAFRDKLETRLAAWEHDGQPRIWDEPAMWGRVRLSVEATRSRLRAVVETHGIDLVVADSLTRFGVRGNGTPEETREFIEWLTELGLGRDLAFLLLHHPRSRPEPGEGELERLAGAWQPHADLILLLQKQDGNRARLSFPKTRWARGQRPASILAFDPRTEAFTYVADEHPDERNLAGELATLMADGEWYTVSALRQPKEKGGVGAQYDAVVEALADDRFESVAGDHLGRRKDWTYYRLRPVSPGVGDGGDTQGHPVRGEAVSPSPPVRENTGGDTALDPKRSGADDPQRPTSIQVGPRTGAPYEVEQLADLVGDLGGELLTSAAEPQEGPDVIDTTTCPASPGWECPCGRERPNARTVVSLRVPNCPFCGRAFKEEYRNTDNGGDAERAPSPAGGASA